MQPDLHEHYVQQDGLHCIESAIPTEVLVIYDTQIHCKENCKTAWAHEVDQGHCHEDMAIPLASAHFVCFGHLAKGIPKYRLTNGFKGASSLAN